MHEFSAHDYLDKLRFALPSDFPHRIRLNYEALAEGVNGAQVLKQLMAEMG